MTLDMKNMKNAEYQIMNQKKIKWNEKMIEFQKAFLKRGKELFADEVIDEYYQKFEEKIMDIKKKIQEIEFKIKTQRMNLKNFEERLKFEKFFLKCGEEVLKKILTD